MTKKKHKIRWEPLFISISLALLVGFLGSLVTAPNIPTWYAALNKPVFNPPNWLFAPVWTALYIMMGISSYLVYAAYGSRSRAVRWYKLYFFQLLLNSLWSMIFFGFKEVGLAFVVILVLWGSIFCLIKEGGKLKLPLSSALLYPYLAWVSFASILNLSIYLLN